MYHIHQYNTKTVDGCVCYVIDISKTHGDVLRAITLYHFDSTSASFFLTNDDNGGRKYTLAHSNTKYDLHACLKLGIL